MGTVGECSDRGDSDDCRELERVCVRAGADGRERNGFEIVLGCQPQRIFITGGEELWLTPTATPPYRTDGMDDPTGFEPVCVGDTSLTGWTAAELATLFQEAWSSRIVNGPINTPAPEEGGVRSVYDRVDVESGDVTTDGMYSSNHIPPQSCPMTSCTSRLLTATATHTPKPSTIGRSPVLAIRPKFAARPMAVNATTIMSCAKM